MDGRLSYISCRGQNAWLRECQFQLEAYAKVQILVQLGGGSHDVTVIVEGIQLFHIAGSPNSSRPY